MKVLIISDAWDSQVNGVVKTLRNLKNELSKMDIKVKIVGPSNFIGVPLIGYKEIKLALFPRRKLLRIIKNFNPENLAFTGTSCLQGPILLLLIITLSPLLIAIPPTSKSIHLTLLINKFSIKIMLNNFFFIIIFDFNYFRFLPSRYRLVFELRHLH